VPTPAPTSRRRLGLLGGTTSAGDCALALTYLANPRRLVRGAAIARYEQAFAAEVGVRYAYSFASGRVGLYGVLRSLGVGEGDEVLLQVPTHIVVSNAIRYTGARPVYVDCTRDTYAIDLDQAAARATQRTKVLLLQHTFGIPAPLDEALELAQRCGLELIEDCVHSLGALHSTRPVGSFGRAAFFSTEETKTISTTMGGMVVTDDPELARRLAAFQASCPWPSAALTARYVVKLAVYHLLTEPHLHRYARQLYERFGERNPLPGPTVEAERRGLKPARYEERLSNAQAALGLRQLRRLGENLRHRKKIAASYEARLSQLGFETPRPLPSSKPAYVRYPVCVADRASAVSGVAPWAVLGTWFTSVLEEAVSPEAGAYPAGSCPTAEALAKHLVNLPTHLRVRPDDVDAIAASLAAATGPGA
jgi:dTDP-4-amino-4,6-dideoxygalactose transaminase